ncbi:hypothetical protein HK102_009555 [Quaeritorhiza haematococci]|nr:hypothetical protein HK102_009555 [Quaeritorhiza haematococci]
MKSEPSSKIMTQLPLPIPQRLFHPSLQIRDVVDCLQFDFSSRKDFRELYKRYDSVTSRIQQLWHLKSSPLQVHLLHFIGLMAFDSILRKRLVEDEPMMKLVVEFLLSGVWSKVELALSIVYGFCRGSRSPQVFAMTRYFLRPSLLLVSEVPTMPDKPFLSAY